MLESTISSGGSMPSRVQYDGHPPPPWLPKAIFLSSRDGFDYPFPPRSLSPRPPERTGNTHEGGQMIQIPSGSGWICDTGKEARWISDEASGKREGC
ncbi:uncharacterized protein N7482_007595 [Penicillium canariense]|uniref:Uncharacterized protein n=1 Tax=Penicillium canariense TaxID=189055 RepID=A0A9W9LKR4_9EURO|nr:uncharacterized protein N7482_007595 [Penicillium canariense]KAJ5160591.1 hypothetical protein N7482_007595 [Penicillium canariense]